MELGISAANLRIKRLAWSRLSSSLAVDEEGRSRYSHFLRRKTSMLPPVIKNLLPWRSAFPDGRLVDNPASRTESDFVVGFYITGRQPE